VTKDYYDVTLLYVNMSAGRGRDAHSKTFDISQGSVATQLRCGGIFIANFLLILAVK